jgi:hypothetical protein
MFTSLETLVANMTVADLARRTGVPVQEIVTLVVHRPRVTEAVSPSSAAADTAKVSGVVSSARGLVDPTPSRAAELLAASEALREPQLWIVFLVI